MFWLILRGALTRQRGKMAMIALTMALGVSLATAMLGVMMDVGDKINQELKTYGANLNVIPRGASILGDLYGVGEGNGVSDKYLAEDELPRMKTIFWAFNIVDFAPYLEMQAFVSGLSASSQAMVVGTWFDKHLDIPTGESVDTGVKKMKSWWDVDGSWASDDPDSPSAMIGASLANELGLGVGDMATIDAKQGEGKKLTISGLINSGGDEDRQLFVPLAIVQEMSGRAGLVRRVEVSALTTPENDLARRAAQDPESLSPAERDTWYCTAYISSIAYQIEEVISDARAKPVLRVAESEGAILQKTQLLMLLLTVLCLACSALAISNLVTASVMERSAEIGLLKALGATGLAISLLIMTEIMITAFAGGAVGYFAGLGFARFIGRTVFGTPVAVKGLVIPIVAILAMAVTFAGSIPAIRMLLSLRPAEVLHGR
ncbi:MAG: ABC transporter permease [Synergistaceae bacterium]|jgi:putative ABC transport system permease protein|nr:ABC transporter permease [Synergistaceae bacterium]